MTWARLKDGRVVDGAIGYSHAHDGIKLAGIPTGEPAEIIHLDERDPGTGLYFRYKHKYRPPTQQELDLWNNDTFRFNGEEVFLKDVELLDILPFCGDCSKADLPCMPGDYLCVYCRYA